MKSALDTLAIIIAITFGSLSGCTHQQQKAPVEEGVSIPSFRLQTHTVAPGETLYSIAWRYDLDYKKLAEINGLSGGLHIRAGQDLALYSPRQLPPTPVKHPPTPPPAAVFRNPPPVVRPVVHQSKKEAPIKPPPPPKTASSGQPVWQWPVKGDLISRFHENGGLNRGIDINAKLGEPVLAAASGEVVYAGSGLRGYGKLLIVKHNEKYLSAYAHNKVLHVAEGDKVKGGQKIAEVGSTGTNVPKLHFEIRHDGQPVDPLQYLPKH